MMMFTQGNGRKSGPGAGGIYTGIAATWARDELADQASVAFIVELPGGELSADQVAAHADAVDAVATEG